MLYNAGREGAGKRRRERRRSGHQNLQQTGALYFIA